MSIEPPAIWQFNAGDLARYIGRYWSCPTDLVHNLTLSGLWRENGTVRGGGTVTSILPLLAIHAFLPQGSTDEWSREAALSYRRIATLAGINKDSVGPAIDRLKKAKLLTVRRAVGITRKPIWYYRLRRTLFPGPSQKYGKISGYLYYSGIFAVMPTPAMRHLYLVLSALDPIHDEDRFKSSLAAGGHDDRAQMLIADYRAERAISITDLVDYTGLARGTILNALQHLTYPVFLDAQGQIRQPLINSGYGRNNLRWYSPNRSIARLPWTLEQLNEAKGLQQYRDNCWPLPEGSL